MKQLYFILLLLLLSAGLTTVGHEVEPHTPAIGNVTSGTIGYAPSNSSFGPTAQQSLPAPASYYDPSSGSNGLNMALCPTPPPLVQNNASSKILKLRLHPAAAMLQHAYWACLLAKEHSQRTFNPNASRYSDGYYIYALAHILI